MSMTSAQLGETVFGNKRITWGKWTGTGTTVVIKTGLAHTEYIKLQLKGADALADEPVIYETLTKAVNLTAIFTDGGEGYWWAFGDA